MSLCMLWALTKWGAVNNIFIYIYYMMMFPHLFQREGWSFLDLSPGQSDATDGGPELQRQDSSVATDIFFTVSFILKT